MCKTLFTALLYYLILSILPLTDSANVLFHKLQLLPDSSPPRIMRILHRRLTHALDTVMLVLFNQGSVSLIVSFVDATSVVPST